MTQYWKVFARPIYMKMSNLLLFFWGRKKGEKAIHSSILSSLCLLHVSLKKHNNVVIWPQKTKSYLKAPWFLQAPAPPLGSLHFHPSDWVSLQKMCPRYLVLQKLEGKFNATRKKTSQPTFMVDISLNGGGLTMAL